MNRSYQFRALAIRGAGGRGVSWASIGPRLSAALLLLVAGSAAAQTSAPVRLGVNLEARIGEMYPMWAYFGYDEANYTYSWEGQKLLTELAELSPVPVYVRAHQLLIRDGCELLVDLS